MIYANTLPFYLLEIFGEEFVVSLIQLLSISLQDLNTFLTELDAYNCHIMYERLTHLTAE